jgi:hypothetical protein
MSVEATTWWNDNDFDSYSSSLWPPAHSPYVLGQAVEEAEA